MDKRIFAKKNFKLLLNGMEITFQRGRRFAIQFRFLILGFKLIQFLRLFKKKNVYLLFYRFNKDFNLNLTPTFDRRLCPLVFDREIFPSILTTKHPAFGGIVNIIYRLTFSVFGNL